MKQLFAILIACVTTGHAFAVTVTISKYMDAPCGNPLGVLDAWAEGGVAPYTFSWSNGANTPHLQGLPPGTYTVTVTDGNGDQATASEEIIYLSSHLYQTGSGYGFRHCDGSEPYTVLHFDPSELTHGPEPHTITNYAGYQVSGITVGLEGWYFVPLGWGAVPGEAVTVEWQDAFGCPGSSSAQVSFPWQPPVLSSFSSAAACNGNNGSIRGTISIPADQYTGVELHSTGGAYLSAQQLNYTAGGDFQFSGLAPGGYWVLFTPDADQTGWMEQGGNTQVSCTDSVYIEVEDHSGQCGVVSGTAFFDHDQDCLRAPGEPAIPFRTIDVEPGDAYGITDAGGGYSIFLANGAYTLALQGSGTDLYALCPPTDLVPITVSGSNIVQDFADSSLIFLNVAGDMIASTARPGFVQTVWLEAKNLSGQLSGALDLVLTIDPALSYGSADAAPTSVAGNTVTWSGLPGLAAFERRRIRVQLQVPPDIALLGQAYTHTLSIAQPTTESSLADNTVSLNGTIMGSYDPNDKAAHTSSDLSSTQYFLDADAWIDYTIRFQNTGTDTAFTVVVKDTLSPLLDMGSFEQGIASHPFEVSFKPGRVVEWRFANILLPDSNVNEPGSHGLVCFRIKPSSDVQIGDVLANTGAIYFDYNPPVITNTAALTAELSTGVLEGPARTLLLRPNPATDHVIMTLPEGGRPAGTVQVFTLDGRSVQLPALVQGRSVELDVQGAAPGIYVVRYASPSGVRTGRFVKR